MNSQIMPAMDSASRFRRHPRAREKFTLARLEAISGVKSTTILRWQVRKAIHVPPVGTGRPRLYSIWDAVHVAVIAEMTKLGLRITGDGQDLSRSLAGYIRVYLIKHGHADEMRSVALWWDDKGSMMMSLNAEDERPGSYMVVGLGKIAKELLDRYDWT